MTKLKESNEKSTKELKREIAFLASRLDNDTEVGISSNAMVAAAVRGQEVPERDYPRDLHDLGRCFKAMKECPIHLKPHMRVTLKKFIASVRKGYEERSDPNSPLFDEQLFNFGDAGSRTPTWLKRETSI